MPCIDIRVYIYMDVSKNRGIPKMDGENNGKAYFLMDDLGGSIIFGNTHIDIIIWPSKVLIPTTCYR